MTRQLALIVIAVAVASGRAADPLPADLALVPADAVGFVHIRAKDLWASDLMTSLRNTVEKAGPKAAAAFDSQFYPAPSSVERVTVIIIPSGRENGPPVSVVFALRFSAPFDVAKLKGLYFPGPAQQAGGKQLLSDADGQVGAYAADAQTLVLGDAPGIKAFASRPGGPEGKVVPALAAAATGKHYFTAAVSVRSIPGIEQQLKGAPPVVAPLIAADLVTLTLAAEGGASKISLAMVYPNEGDAKDAETALKALCLQGKLELKKVKGEMETALYRPLKDGQTHRPLTELPEAGAALLGLGAFAQLEEWLDNPPVRRAGNTLGAEVVIPKEITGFAGAYSAVAIGLLLPAVQKVREAAARMTGSNNLKQIGLALHNMHDAYGHFPSAAPKHSPASPADPKKRLSWRVHILPFIEQDALYKQFKLDEPWDSEANKKAAEVMPKIFTDPRADAPAGTTYYKVFTGKAAMFDLTDRGRRITDVTDGTSNTIMVVAGGEPVPWAKPDDIEFDPTKALPDLAKAFGGRINVLMGDGSVRLLDLTKLKPEMLKAAITLNGGEVTNLDGDSDRLPVPSSSEVRDPVKK